MNEITLISPKRNINGLALLADFFHQQILLLEDSQKINLALQKQKVMKSLRLSIERFALSNPHAVIEVCVLGESNHIEDVDYSMSFKNFNEFSLQNRPSYFRIVIDETWSTLTIFQRSIDGIAYGKLPEPKVQYDEATDYTID